MVAKRDATAVVKNLDCNGTPCLFNQNDIGTYILYQQTQSDNSNLTYPSNIVEQSHIHIWIISPAVHVPGNKAYGLAITPSTNNQSTTTIPSAESLPVVANGASGVLVDISAIQSRMPRQTFMSGQCLNSECL